MRNTSVRVAGASVAVHCVGDDGLPIVLVHGNTGSHRCFQQQFDSPLAERFRLIAVDLPGHGDSEPALDPAATYTLPGHARALVEVARALDATDGVFVGWSLGGYVVLEAIPQLPRAAGFLVIGAPPIASAADLAGRALPGSRAAGRLPGGVDGRGAGGLPRDVPQAGDADAGRLPGGLPPVGQAGAVLPRGERGAGTR